MFRVASFGGLGACVLVRVCDLLSRELLDVWIMCLIFCRLQSSCGFMGVGYLSRTDLLLLMVLCIVCLRVLGVSAAGLTYGLILLLWY